MALALVFPAAFCVSTSAVVSSVEVCVGRALWLCCGQALHVG